MKKLLLAALLVSSSTFASEVICTSICGANGNYFRLPGQISVKTVISKAANETMATKKLEAQCDKMGGKLMDTIYFYAGDHAPRIGQEKNPVSCTR
jgi:hypothetical protein